MRVTSYTARSAVVAIALLLMGLQGVHATNRSPSGTSAQEPAVLKAIAAAQWRVADARPALPPVQDIHNEELEIQDSTEYAFEGGALRLYVSPDPKGGDIFALMVDTREPRYANFVHLASTDRYKTYHQGAYVLVVPLRPISQKLFESLKSRQWTDGELQQELGTPSYHWHFHGISQGGQTYVPEGLSFIGQQRGLQTPVLYQIYAAKIQAEREKEQEYDLPPLASLSRLDYAGVQRVDREDFAKRILSQREQIDLALAAGKRSPDGRFVVGHVNLGGLANTEQVVIREGRKPERRYLVPHFTEDKDYLWLNDRTILFEVYTIDQDFYTIDAPTGAMKVAVSVPYDFLIPDNPDRIIDFGISGPQQFWYKTAWGERREVTVESLTPQH